MLPESFGPLLRIGCKMPRDYMIDFEIVKLKRPTAVTTQALIGLIKGVSISDSELTTFRHYCRRPSHPAGRQRPCAADSSAHVVEDSIGVEPGSLSKLGTCRR
jgi:hypothetical protein